MTAAAGGGPTVRRILLGSQLRRLREEKHISREEAGYHIRASESKISRLELGRVSFKERDVADLLTLYGVTDEAERAPVLALVREANQQGWWQSYSDALPNWFQPYLGLEESASLIRTYELQFVPGLLQTEDYARAVISQGRRRLPREVVDARVDVRMNRQKVLTEGSGPRLWVVIDEGALRRPIGGLKIMRAQIEHLLDLTDQPRLTLQVMPFAFGGHAAEGGAFSILRFPDADMTDVVYLEQLGGAVYLDKREYVDRYTIAMNRLGLDSCSPDETIGVLRKMANGL
ncbi:helix-turn-helix domain-containing protein [Frankia sp. CNm7]|uniref:Helix-turn-helix domain-containing protein n=1 Tax=Frankia nepalensis TaxID=1836974 RepID=A0A937RS57_9ACTN|nr:helix-turn-helix transcriptional regulator [Frankia nepalensis]MBL7502575.1 helix-turn-helix domain-containing protein [Frankia nepalensis]MBL7515481.1 helix-turn-helix domain-containing protein [Frankia nepalensis]MBL7517666.1 helix-turn-helix domain-containing protein [Frankia nepalensis]MBL7631748.1 helix-turn-helix domain-containing protein [Frankia nepalensis]